ncbi:MAG TPA: hypothetical protein VLS89_07080, partial [Candidatus Nanopelagicales bacterium]|nr:hypothetical protein [Candidatus Nanopelagicales bacterium]
MVSVQASDDHGGDPCFLHGGGRDRWEVDTGGGARYPRRVARAKKEKTKEGEELIVRNKRAS